MIARDGLGDRAADVAAVGALVGVAEAFGHQLRELGRHAAGAERLAFGSPRKPVSRQARHDDVERIGGVAALGRRVGEQRVIFIIRRNESGQPWLSSSGIGCGPRPRTWMK